MAANAKAKFLLVVLVAVLLGLLVVLDARRRQAESELENLTMRLEQLQGGNPEENKQVARMVVTKLRKHIMMPADIEPTVAQIVDAEKLKQQNPFYANAQNGDYLVITPTRAMLYSPQQDIIIDVIPVQLNQQAASSAGPQPAPQPPVAKPTPKKPEPAPAPKPAETPKQDEQKKQGQ